MSFGLIFFLLEMNLIYSINAQLNMSQYFRMPTLNRFDNYHECMGIFGDAALYCVVDTFIKPDSNSDIYKLIEEQNKETKKNFRHDNLMRGLCVNRCKAEIDKLGTNAEDYLVEKFPIESKILYHSVNYFNSKKDRVMYADLINKCVNIELMEKYKLKGFSAIEYCLNETEVPPLDYLDIFAAFFIITLLLVVIASSLFDRFLRNLLGLNAKTHYGNPPESKLYQIFTLFSIRRNWRLLGTPDPENRELRFIQATRVITMTALIFGHTCYFAEMIPTANPEANEGGYSSFASMLIINGLNAAQLFFVISGFLSTYFFLCRKPDGNTSNLRLFFRKFLLRYLRLAPLLAIAILLHSTWLYRIGRGPIFNRNNYAEQQFCRTHWWKNLLMIDNYTNVPEKCLIQTWYVACEFWISAACTIFLMVIKKKPGWTKPLLSLISFLSTFSYGYVTYINEFDAVPLFSQETVKNRLVPVDANQPNYFERYYTQTHWNFGNFFIGVAFGLLYFNYKSNNKTLPRTFLLRFLWYFCFAAMPLNVMLGYFFYNYEFEKPSILIAIIAVLMRYSWGLIAGYLGISTIHRFGWFFPNILNHPAWTIPARLTYSAYIFHLFVTKLVVMDIYQPIYMDTLKFFTLGIGLTVMSLAFGLFFTLSIEVPMFIIARSVFGRKENSQELNGVQLMKISETTPMRVGEGRNVNEGP